MSWSLPRLHAFFVESRTGKARETEKDYHEDWRNHASDGYQSCHYKDHGNESNRKNEDTNSAQNTRNNTED